MRTQGTLYPSGPRRWANGMGLPSPSSSVRSIPGADPGAGGSPWAGAGREHYCRLGPSVVRKAPGSHSLPPEPKARERRSKLSAADPTKRSPPGTGSRRLKRPRRWPIAGSERIVQNVGYAPARCSAASSQHHASAHRGGPEGRHRLRAGHHHGDPAAACLWETGRCRDVIQRHQGQPLVQSVHGFLPRCL
jgi:hypothetical protein